MKKNKKILLSLLVFGISASLCAAENEGPRSFMSSVRERLPDSDAYLQLAAIVGFPAAAGGGFAFLTHVAFRTPIVRRGFVLVGVASGAAVGAISGLSHFEKSEDVGESIQFALARLLSGAGDLLNHGSELIYSTKETVPTDDQNK